jgi:hypothetical protein
MPSSRLTSALDSVAESSLRRESAAVLVAAGIAFLQTTRSGGAASYRATNTGQDKLTSVFNAPEPKAGRRQPRSRPATHGQQQHVRRQHRSRCESKLCTATSYRATPNPNAEARRRGCSRGVCVHCLRCDGPRATLERLPGHHPAAGHTKLLLKLIHPTRRRASTGIWSPTMQASCHPLLSRPRKPRRQLRQRPRGHLWWVGRAPLAVVCPTTHWP